jgi:hypothetical protein
LDVAPLRAKLSKFDAPNPDDDEAGGAEMLSETDVCGAAVACWLFKDNCVYKLSAWVEVGLVTAVVVVGWLEFVDDDHLVELVPEVK